MGPDIVGDLEAAIAEFRAALPGWWFTVGHCALSRDASCGPDGRALAHYPLAFDGGFHCDDQAPDSTLAGSLRDVTRQALAAIAGAAEIPVDDAAGAAGGGPPPSANLVSGEASRPAAQAESG